MANFLDLTTGLPALWAKIKSKFYTKAEVDALIPEDEVMWVTITSNSTEYIADKTPTEIYNHVSNGGVAFAKYAGNTYTLGSFNREESVFLFTTMQYDGVGECYIIYIEESYVDVYTYVIAPSNINPLMDGIASSGSLNNYSRSDHVHPSDTSRAAVADVLTKTNTTSYTPTADYNPATKKYVDDTIPTKTSDLTNDSLFLSGSAQSDSYASGYILIGKKNNSSATLADTLQVSSTTTGNPSQTLTVGRSHSDDGFKGEIQLSNRPSKGDYTTITPTANSAITLSLPSASGTLALTTDISTNLSGLADTNISNPADGQALIYDSTNSKWVNGDVSTEICEIVVTHDENNDTFSIDKTAEEIINAYNQGLNIVAIMDDDMDHIYLLLSEATFGFTNNHDKILSGLTFYSKESGIEIIIDGINNNEIYVQVEQKFVYFTYDSTTQKYTANISRTHIGNDCYYLDSSIGEKSAIINKREIINSGLHYTLSFISDGKVKKLYNSPDMGAFEWVDISETGVTETRVNELIAAALAQYGDGDTMAYGGV